jgi:hypothetical protein
MIAPAIRRLTSAAVLFTVVASVPSLWANAADDVKPYSIKRMASSIKTPSPVIFTTRARVIGATGRMQPVALLPRHWSTD